MINLPYIPLPEYFAKLLVANIQPTASSIAWLEQFLISNKELNFLAKNICTDIDPEGEISRIVQILGWSNLRNRLSAAYMEHSLVGSFPHTANAGLVADLLVLENKLKQFSNNGFSRVFLLAFYARLSLIKLKKNVDTASFSPLLITDAHLNFLKWSKSKSTRIDWLLLQIILFESYLGTKTLDSMLSSGGTFQSLFVLLSAEEQRDMMKNLINYGSSIYDMDFFTVEIFGEH